MCVWHFIFFEQKIIYLLLLLLLLLFFQQSKIFILIKMWPLFFRMLHNPNVTVYDSFSYICWRSVF
ncbi:hypothetical protein ACMBCM_09815, partial [Spiroplasma sp. K1]